MKTSQNGLVFLKNLEGLKLKAYPDSGKLWTIGIGTTVYPNGQKVKEGDTCTEAQAYEYCQHDLARFENAINSVIKVPLNQNQFDALVSLWYNTGGSKTLPLLINSNAHLADIINWWQSHFTTVKGKICEGLITRRGKEAQLYSKT